MSVKIDRIALDDVTLLYADNGVVGFSVVPTETADKVAAEKFERNKPMVQLSLEGDVGEREYFSGNCMQNAQSCYDFKFVRRDVKKAADTEIVTYFENGKGLFFEHHVVKPDGVNALKCFNVIRNNGADVTIEMIASFSFSGITPFCKKNDSDALNIYRMTNCWSGEGKLEKHTAAELRLEDSWTSYGIRQDRIGQTGSMPCRKYLPFYAVEDVKNGCVWAVTAEVSGSWQIDAVHHNGSISLTGGLADFCGGHFRKTLNRGDVFTTPAGYIATVKGGIDRACEALKAMYAHYLKVPKVEEDLPIVYNEYCWSWGKPRMEALRPVIDECARLGVGEFVIDAGWWDVGKDGSWATLGDWNVNREAFPNGLKEFCDIVKLRGMVPGIWFEFEAVSTDSEVFKTHPDWLITRDGHPIIRRERAFLDFRKPAVIDYLNNKVIRLLKDCGFGYMKIDYNEAIDIGCDGAESYGEGLRAHLQCVTEFIKSVKREIPDIVIEICSSGGHRLEPAFLSLASQASFSDAHLDLDGAVIASDLTRYMLPRQMQVWATLETKYSMPRTYFTLAKAMTGRLGISGDLCALSAEQTRALEQAIAFYGKIKNIVKDGIVRANINDGITSLCDLHGKRFLLMSDHSGSAAAYIFDFDCGDASVRCDALKDYELTDFYSFGKVSLRGDTLTVKGSGEPIGAVALLKKK